MIMVNTKQSHNVRLKDDITVDCTVCQDLLANIEMFFGALELVYESHRSQWLTVENVAKELKVSKSIVYRLIRHGELEAVDIVETDGEIAKKGHYRVKRSKLNQYLEHKKVKPFPNTSTHRTHSRHVPKPKNHLGL